MKDESIKGMENLSKTCYRSGVFSVFLGILIGFVGIVNKDWFTATIGLFVFIVAYSYIKISGKISGVLSAERG